MTVAADGIMVGMPRTPQTPAAPAFQRNALAPGLIAAAVLFAAPALFAVGWDSAVLFPTAILALIVAWFAVQARQCWWPIVFAAIAVVWNPVYPFDFSGTPWVVAQPVAAVVFLVAGVLIKSPRD